MEDLADGRYVVSYVTQRAGEALLRIFKTVTLSGTTLEQSICTSTSAKAHCLRSSRINPQGTLLLTFTSSQPQADESVVYSMGTTLEKASAGTEATFYISAHDRFRNVQTQEGFLFTVLLTHQVRPTHSRQGRAEVRTSSSRCHYGGHLTSCRST